MFEDYIEALKKLETINSVNRENVEKLKGATEIEFVVEKLLDQYIQLSYTIESILAIMQKMAE